MITKEQVLNATGSELDELVALAQGWAKSGRVIQCWVSNRRYVVDCVDYTPTTNGTQCIEIMEREKIEVKPKVEGWLAKIDNDDCFASSRGKTTMIAICRCFVLGRLEVTNGE